MEEKTYIDTNRGGIIRRADKMWIPKDETLPEYQEYLRWLEDGNTPDIEEAE